MKIDHKNQCYSLTDSNRNDNKERVVMVNQVGTLRTVLKMDYITQQMYGPLLSTASAKMGVKKQMIIVS